MHIIDPARGRIVVLLNGVPQSVLEAFTVYGNGRGVVKDILGRVSEGHITFQVELPDPAVETKK